MSEPAKELPINPAPEATAAAPAVEGDGDGQPSKKGAKKAEAKAKKEAEKARKAAEREAAAAKTSGASAVANDAAKENYGDSAYPSKAKGERVSLKDLGQEHVGKTIKFRGGVQNIRKQGAKMVFLELRAFGAFGAEQQTIQALVVENNEGENVIDRAMIKWTMGLSSESCVEVQAIVKATEEPVKSVSVSGYELHIQKIYLVAAAPTQLAVTWEAANKASVGSAEADTSDPTGPAVGFAVMLDTPAMRFRGTPFKAISKVRRSVEIAFRTYLEEQDFILFHPPALIGAASEGGANVFALDYFDKGMKAYLAQSPQFYKQMKIAGGERRVYCVAPVFRAENANTPRHVTEFIGLDLEMEIDDHYHEVLHMLQSVLLYIFKYLAAKCKPEIEYLKTIYPCEEFLLPEDGKEVILTFAEGQKLLREKGPEEFKDVKDDEDMSTPQEKALGAFIRQEYKTDFYVLDKFPTSARPFYAYTDPENPQVTNAYDFFMRGQEILSGGQRYHKPEELVESMKAKGVDPNSAGLKEYVDVFRSAGVPPHGGGGIGLDRIVAWYLNLPNIQMVSDFPRTPNRLSP